MPIGLGMGDPRLIIDPTRHAHVRQRTGPAHPQAGNRLVRDQANIDAAMWKQC
jgi:hypothetical protein